MTVEQSLARAPGATERLWSLGDLQRAVLLHRDSFRANLASATRPRHADPAMTYPVKCATSGVVARIFYGRDGRVEYHINNIIRFDRLPPERDVVLRDQDFHAIAALRNDLESRFLYSTAAAPLALARVVRLAQERGDQQLSFDTALEWLNLPGHALLSDYGGGTCMSLAEALAEDIKERLHLDAFVAAQSADNIITAWPRLARQGHEGNRNAYEAVEGATHTNVVIPHRDLGGSRRWLRIVCGTGASNARDDFMWSFDEDQLEPFFIGNPGRLTAQAIRSLCKIHMTDRVSGATVGLDFLRGSLYVNRRALGTNSEGRGREASAEDTANYLTDRIGGRVPQSAFFEVLSVAAEKLCLPRAAAQDLYYLATHVDEFCDQVLVPPARTLRLCIKNRDEAVAAYAGAVAAQETSRGSLDSEEGKKAKDIRMARARSALALAEQAISRGDACSANAAYRDASAVLSGRDSLTTHHSSTESSETGRF